MSQPVRPRTQGLVDYSFAYRLDVLERLGLGGDAGSQLQARQTCCECWIGEYRYFIPPGDCTPPNYNLFVPGGVDGDGSTTFAGDMVLMNSVGSRLPANMLVGLFVTWPKGGGSRYITLNTPLGGRDNRPGAATGPYDTDVQEVWGVTYDDGGWDVNIWQDSGGDMVAQVEVIEYALTPCLGLPRPHVG